MKSNETLSQKLGRLIGGHPFGFCVAVGVLLALLYAAIWGYKVLESREAARIERVAMDQARQRREAKEEKDRVALAALRQKCGPDFAALAQPAAALLSAKKAAQAFELVKPCTALTDASPEVKTILATFEASAVAEGAAKQKAESARLLALKRDVAAADKARLKKEGVSLGMTPEEVVASSWGKPSKVNRSTYTFGVREQWVYGSGNYLYFRDGKLNSIQN